MHDLNELVVDIAGWVLREASDINYNGSIVGFGTFAGQSRAYVLVQVVGTISPFDLDRDGDVDFDDFGIFQTCYSGPSVVADQDCLAADFDDDQDVDQTDFGLLQRCYSGPDISSEPNCMGLK
jgi:hypothetical protein